jgi:hypothetical protein
MTTTKKRVLIIEEDETVVDEATVSVAVDTMVAYMADEHKNFIESLSGDDFCDKELFTERLESHIYYSVLVLENRGSKNALNRAIETLWWDSRADYDEEYFCCIVCRCVKDIDEQHTDEGHCGDCVPEEEEEEEEE